ncbi:hypothetical protein AL486_18915 [Pandoraea apista]|uniref:hypothetical protein n=1 Tax=Pandoraea apista TaxID=93218 RepID=UPI000CE98238|nr:hypothetical protein [Pandoraea apista]AVF41536.1 hypothetical protein AL486_18915 [Pandoraea apista]
MPDLKTVTFDAELMRRAFNIAMNADWHEESPTTFVMRSVWETAWRAAMLAAAPTPAAQSAGQEVIYQYMTEAGDWADTDWMDYQSAEVEKRIVYAAPVNGGERVQFRYEGSLDWIDCDPREGVVQSGIEHRVVGHAADAQQVGGDRDAIAELIGRLEAKYGLEFTVTKRTGEKTHHVGFDRHPLIGRAVDYLRAAITSPAKVGGDEREAAFRRIMGDLSMPADEASSYDQWLFNKTWDAAMHARIALLAPSTENAAHSEALFLINHAIDVANTYETGEHDDLRIVTLRMDEARRLLAALSADGGDREDAERYRIVRHKVCIVGDAFHIINLRPTYVAPDAGAELDAVVDAIAAKAKGDAQ